MDELKQRLEYLEHVCQGYSEENNLQNQVDEIGSMLDTMLGVRKQEAVRMHNEFRKRGTIATEDVANPPGIQQESFQTKNDIIKSRASELRELIDELGPHSPLKVPEVSKAIDTEELVRKASELGKEFDELTARSAELTKKLMDQVAAENEALGQQTDTQSSGSLE